MSTIFTRVLSGQVDVIPGDVRMLSTASPAEVLAPGFLNRVATAANFTIFETDVISAIYGDPQIAAIFKPSLSGGVYTLVPIAGASGEANTSSNVGAGEKLALPKSGVDLPFKTLEAGANISLIPTGNSVIIEAVIPDVGEANTASNVGLGAGVFKQKVGVDLQLKSLAAGPGISVSNGTNELTITATNSGDITNGNNLGGGEPVFAGKTGSLLDFKTLVAGTNVSFSANANELTISASGGGGGGNFLYEDTWFVAKNGNDSNDGKSVNTPKLTMSAVNAAFVNLRNVVNVLDNGVYPCFLFGGQVANAVTYVNAPAAFFTAVSSAPVFQTDTTHTLIVDCFSVEGFGGTTAPLVSYNSGVSYMEINCSILSGNGARIYAAVLADLDTVAVINADIILGLDMEFSSRLLINADKVFSNFITSNFAGSGLLVADIKDHSGTITGTGEVQGVIGRGAGQVTDYYGSNIDLNNQYFGNEIYGRMYTSPLAVTWSFIPGAQNGNLQILVTNHDGAIIFPPGSSAPEGWRMTIVQTDYNSGAKIQPQGLDTLVGQIGSTSQAFTGRGKCEVIRGPSNGAGGFHWIVTGDVFGSNDFTLNGIYVSADSGDDVFGNGSFKSPLATIGAAVTLAGAPANTLPIYLVGAQTYDEQVVMPNPNVAIIGPQSVLFSTTGDALTISSTGGNHPIFLGGLGSSVGRSLVGTKDSVIVTNVTAFIQGAIEINDNQIFIGNSTLLDVDIKVAGTGFANYSTAQHSGTNTGAVFGMDPTGTTTDWNVAGNLTATGLDYPVADGTAGQFMVTDGAGTLSFATPSSGGLAYATIAGTSQAAAINTAYLSANPAQTTITLPATAVFGDKVKVYGYGAAGWILQANTGQTINLGTSSTTVAGSLTSVAATDLVEVTCLVANTLWQVDYVYSAGLTVA